MNKTPMVATGSTLKVVSKISESVMLQEKVNVR